ncbi:MAG: hypothetical protein SVT52_09075, partial [Planctomycetota bacterium]|nr:hypothetical protein [Planctomycetota bacterium]
VYRLGPAHSIVVQSVESMGGLRAWEKICRIHASAVVTTYDADGQPYTNRQQQVIALKDRTITATASTPQGSWSAVVKKDKLGRLNTVGFDAGEEFRNRVESSLATILHRVGGPVNLLLGCERVAGAVRCRFGDKESIRVPVAGDGCFALAYYFDPGSGMLQFVTSDADRPGQVGTVTSYSYAMQPNGLVFPRKIRVTCADQDNPASRKPVMEVEFADIRFE